jgi:hypothetical protein
MSRRAAERGGRLVLFNLNPTIREIFSPLPSHASRPGWRGPFFARTLEEARVLCEGGLPVVRPGEGDA